MTLFCCLIIGVSAVAQTGQLVYPPDGSVGIGVPVTFEWTSGTANVWLLEISDTEGSFLPAVSEVTYGSDYTVSSLDHNRTYYWRVRHGVDAGGDILWGDYTASQSFLTAIDGCCTGNRGNIDGDPLDVIDISDLVYLVDYMFTQGPPIPCVDEADVSPLEEPDGIIDIADLIVLVDFMFGGGPPPGPCPPAIEIVGLVPGADTVHGTATAPDTTGHMVVLYAATNLWYVQPYVTEPFTYIGSDGSWSNFTHGWDRMLALLVDSTYVPAGTRDYHPSLDPGVIAWDEYPDSSLRYIDWSGYRWQVKKGNLVGPGPNYFSDDPVNVRIDAEGRLHLAIDVRDNIWYCAEIILDHSLGYGVYSFKLDSRVDSLDYNAILGAFIYDTTAQEFDFEFSQRLANPFNAQYVVQPWYTPGNIVYYHMPTSAQSTHVFEWRADRIVFASWKGHSDTPTPETLIYNWTYTGGDIPIPGIENMRFNLHLFGGEAPIGGQGDEVVVSSFEYTE